MLPSCPPHYQHHRPTDDPSVPFSPKNISQTPPPPLCRESMFEYLVTKKHIGLAEREIHVLVYGYYDFPKPSIHGFPTVVDPVDRSCRCLI
jgi:hypothetical protein